MKILYNSIFAILLVLVSLCGFSSSECVIHPDNYTNFYNLTRSGETVFRVSAGATFYARCRPFYRFMIAPGPWPAGGWVYAERRTFRCSEVNGKAVVVDVVRSQMMEKFCQPFCTAPLLLSEFSRLSKFDEKQHIPRYGHVSYSCLMEKVFSGGSKTDDAKCMYHCTGCDLSIKVPLCIAPFGQIANIVVPVIISVIVLAALMISIWLKCFKYKDNPNVKLGIIFPITMNLIDVMTDFIFMIKLIEIGHYLRWFSICFLVLPLGCNFVLVLCLLKKELRENTKFKLLLESRSQLWFGLAYFFGVLRVDTLELLSSQLNDAFKFDEKREMAGTIRYLGIVGLVLEDIPQIVITSIFTKDSPEFAGVSSLVVSGFNFVFTLVLYSVTLARDCKRRRDSERRSGHVKLSKLPSVRRRPMRRELRKETRKL
eukprot:959962_1